VQVAAVSPPCGSIPLVAFPRGSEELMLLEFVEEPFTEEERAALAPYFTNLDGPVFALVNLPEVVKGALFARYSRSAKSLRRLFLDEFLESTGPPEDASEAGRIGGGVGVGRAERLYERVFLEYGDDSVAQLGGVHLACEQSSQLLAKVLERGRLAGYLEQSTRYVTYDDRPGGRWRYVLPYELGGHPGLADRYRRTLDDAFETYARWLEPMQEHLRRRHPQDPGDPDVVYRTTVRAKACDALRGLLPAATRSNVGIYASAQTYEQLLLRMRADPLAEVRTYAALILTELRKVIPAFLTRVDVEDRGVAWSRYLEDTRVGADEAARMALEESGWGREAPKADPAARAVPEVSLADFDPEGETKVVAAALYAATQLSDAEALDAARGLSDEQRAAVLRAYAGERANRRHKPGRAFERTAYRFDVVCDYGAFRDLQRHRMLSIEWQPLGPELGFETPPDVVEAGAGADWTRAMEASAELFHRLREAGLGEASRYAVAMAYRIRFAMHMNAREALHVIELRTSPQGHPVYRRVCQEMHRLIAEEAGHRAIAEAMRFVDRSTVDLERLEAERRIEAKRRVESNRMQASESLRPSPAPAPGSG
jgi:thymidylate synthase ThyX